jgi:RimJ/RimL family protein N-acetyltransferase
VTVCRPPKDDDVPALMALRNDLPTQHALLAAPRPNRPEDVRAWIERRTENPTAIFRVVADGGDAAVGFTQIVEIDERSRHGVFGIAIDERHRGRGHGRAALEQTLDAARADGRLDKVMLYVAADNAPARALYASAGFREVGVHRRHYRGPDRWHDVAVMERFLNRETP